MGACRREGAASALGGLELLDTEGLGRGWRAAGDLRELPRVSLRVEGYCGVGGASRDSAGFVTMEEGLISWGGSPLPKAAVVPSAQTLKITDFSFSDFELSDLETALCTIRMFTDLNLVQNFQMKHEVAM